MNPEHISCETDGALLIVTLNRPDKLNAYTGQMGAELTEAFSRADGDDNVRAVIVTGAGRAFCAGADVSGGAASFDTSGAHGAGVFAAPKSGGSRFVEAIFNCRKPSIAAINGAAVGVGITMTLPMDIRIAAKGAKIDFIFARRGLVPEAGSAWSCQNSSGCRRRCAGVSRDACLTPTRRCAAASSARWSRRRRCSSGQKRSRAR
jgi:enoyl-CoA hydratase/carnithine racemase